MNNEIIKDEIKTNMFQVLIISISMFLTIISVSLLHTNEYEFISLRFGITGETAYYDFVLYLSYLIWGIVTGILADRFGKRKRFVIVGSVGTIISFFLMIATPPPYYGLLLIFRFSQGCFTIMCWQILMTMILDISNSENRGKCLGILGIFLALAMGIGPMLGGMIAKYGIFVPYYIAIGANAIVLLITFFIIKEPSFLKKRPLFKENIKIINRAPKLILPGIFNFVDRLHMGFIIYILPLYIANILFLGTTERGMVMGIFALPFIILQYPIGKLSDKYGRYKFLIWGSFSYGIMLSLTGYFGLFGLGALIICFIILGTFSGVTGPPSVALVGDIVDVEDRAMGMGFFNFLGNLGLTLGPLIGFILVPNFQESQFIIAFIVAGLIELITLGINLLLIRKFHGSP